MSAREIFIYILTGLQHGLAIMTHGMLSGGEIDPVQIIFTRILPIFHGNKDSLINLYEFKSNGTQEGSLLPQTL